MYLELFQKLISIPKNQSNQIFYFINKKIKILINKNSQTALFNVLKAYSIIDPGKIIISYHFYYFIISFKIRVGILSRYLFFIFYFFIFYFFVLFFFFLFYFYIFILGMNFVAANLLMHLNEEDSFWLLVQLLKAYDIRGIFAANVPDLM